MPGSLLHRRSMILKKIQRQNSRNFISVFFYYYFYIINLFNIIQHSIAINFTLTGRQKEEGQNVEKNKKKQAEKAEYESSTDKQKLEEQIER